MGGLSGAHVCGHARLGNLYPDEAVALQRFFELLDEHGQRVPREVAHVDDHAETVSRLYPEWGEITLRGRLSLLVYTDDPGFFSHFPTDLGCRKDKLHPALDLSDFEGMVITDPAIYERLLAEKRALELLEEQDQ